MAIDRRTFITGSCMTAAAFAELPKWAAIGPLREPGSRRAAQAADTVLVVVDMNGGNDGLNTLVPFGEPAYAAARPRIALTGSQLLRIDPKTGLHPSLANLYGYLNSGRLAIVQGVGYPRADMSHFRSDDIWEKAVLDPETQATGWIGRTLDQLYAQNADALHGAGLSGDVPALHGRYVTSPVVSDPGSSTYPQNDPAQTAALKTLFPPGGALNRDYVSHVGRLALTDADAIQTALANYQPAVAYPKDSGLANGLSLTVAVIAADLGPRVFWIVQGGYDTHGNQLGDQGTLLRELDQSLDAFYRDLVAHGHDQRVVVMTYSEFGRRVEDNGSGGTDHGTAGLMFVLGTKVRGGLFGTPPSLTELDPDGNLRFSTDFRSVYASILANWIDADPNPILFGNYPMLSFL